MRPVLVVTGVLVGGAVCRPADTVSIQYLRILEHLSSEIKIPRNNICCDASTMCDETFYWYLNYSLQLTPYTW